MSQHRTALVLLVALAAFLLPFACAEEPGPQPVQGPYLDEKPLQSIDGTEWDTEPTATGLMHWVETSKAELPLGPCSICVNLPDGEGFCVAGLEMPCQGTKQYPDLADLLIEHDRKSRVIIETSRQIDALIRQLDEALEATR